MNKPTYTKIGSFGLSRLQLLIKWLCRFAGFTSVCTLLATQLVFAQQGAVDKVLVIVNDDVITQSEFSYRRNSVINDIVVAGKTVPDGINEQLLETMVSELMQVQEAERRGIDISDEELQQALIRFAAQQDLTLDQLKVEVAKTGQPFSAFSRSVRDSITISRFADYYARSRVVVPDYEIDGWLSANNLDKDAVEYEIAQILIKGGEDKLQVAEEALDAIQRGLSFEQAVVRYSEAADANDGGMLGWRRPEQLPSLFVNAIKDIEVGAVSDILESPNGYHILKLVNLKGERSEILQSKVRHFLISANSRIAKAQAIKKANQLRDRIVAGEQFETIARIFSDDSGSAALGGDLGWVSPGQMVPEFEKTFTEMAIGQVSMPFTSQYGVHVLVVEDRRKKNVTEQIKRARAENILRRQRADREFSQWVRELQEGAYIKHVSKPA
ncbi:MAG: peptidylprolyl isomerase [Gammaproteobacteria bacterium]|nr:peptidylprolyl isomerase [Gammaproteobacteria bacterium]